MADNAKENMILRTVYLPADLDHRLKITAFLGNRSKNDVIRELILAGLDTLVAKGDQRFASAPLQSAGAPVAAKAAPRQRDDAKPARSRRAAAAGRARAAAHAAE